MRERRYTILSTAILPSERIGHFPETIDIRVIPFTEIVAREDEEIKSAARAIALKRATVVFTSAYAVKFLTTRLEQKPDWKIYCLENETRRAVSKWFGPDSIVQTASDARLLSESMISDGVKEAVFFCGDQRKDTLPDNLRAHPVLLHEIIVYDTRLTPVRIHEPLDAILFFSPSAVRSFFSMNEVAPATILFALGRTTAEELHTFTDNPVILSLETDKAILLKQAFDYAASHPIT